MGKLINVGFDESQLDMIDIDSSDFYFQKETYKLIWKWISEADVLQHPKQVRTFINNLQQSKLNIILNNNENMIKGMQYFLDVNLKGVKLDVEDIFKGYLFSHDERIDIRDAWKGLKCLAHDIEKDCHINIMKLIEHNMHCSLYEQNFENVDKLDFGENFTLKGEVDFQFSRCYTGEHIIRVISDNEYFLNMIEKTRYCTEFYRSIVQSDRPDTRFKAIFKSTKIDSIEIVVIHNLLKKILLDKNNVPKVLVMKYTDMLLELNNLITKKDVRKIYAIFVMSILFTIFETKKSSTKLNAIVKSANWYEDLVDSINNYCICNNVVEKQIVYLAGLKSNSDLKEQYRCKSLATIYNYIQLTDDEVKVKKGCYNDLNEFVTNSSKYSIEHFIINESGKISEDDIDFNYPKDLKRHRNSLFNFIFIPLDLNSAIGNYSLRDKTNYLLRRLEKVDCEYSKFVISLGEILPANNDNHDFSKYYIESFKKEYMNYANRLIEEIFRKIRE